MVSSSSERRYDIIRDQLNAYALFLAENDLSQFDLDELYTMLRSIDRWGKHLYRFFGQYLSPPKNKVDFRYCHDEERERALHLKSILDGLQSSFRTHINAVSRPYLRPLTIRDMPNKILSKIFECVKGSKASTIVISMFPVVLATSRTCSLYVNASTTTAVTC
ncbi:uncharacterized protein LY89DRAFT_741467 [Mollisia scopiformis]|uniref:F-box domain-containing protein n=1 Tax=Mollisia scopiformis TaxID=149040 RepID=A0A132BBF5_MOLSC|nr:uncharacterized protein LY89DRAFT_741467 [Mollisia scopiformis]KUJ09174.1 hypothetical protein LY89DRAFT_741467 [Mollisia scopiformis]